MSSLLRLSEPLRDSFSYIIASAKRNVSRLNVFANRFRIMAKKKANSYRKEGNRRDCTTKTFIWKFPSYK